MNLEDILEQFPSEYNAPDGTQFQVRPLTATNEQALHQLFCALPDNERLLIKHRVTDPAVVHEWCQNIDYGRILPLLAFDGQTIVADASLHQTLGGWKRHIGRISVLVHPDYRGRGLAYFLVKKLIEIARNLGLERLEAEFLGEQAAGRHVCGRLGFSELVLLKDYVKDMQAIAHDYVLMGRPLITDEEYAGAN
jgi:GNAT superfamily N-acetyltransferase